MSSNLTVTSVLIQEINPNHYQQSQHFGIAISSSSGNYYGPSTTKYWYPLLQAYDDKNEYYYCFRSSKPDPNPVIGIDNLDMIKTAKYDGIINYVPYKNGLVHKGFLEITQNLLNDTVNNIYECRNIILTGHSLGGAIALLMGIELNDMGYNVKTYTFGQPKIGDNNLNRMIGFQNYRFVHDKDIVPHLPPFPEYQHQCNEIFQVGNIIKKESFMN